MEEKAMPIWRQMKNLMYESCFQVNVPVIVTSRQIEKGEQLFVDYTGGKKNTYLLSSKKIAQLISDGKIRQSQVSPCLDSKGGICSCGRFFIIPSSQLSSSLSALESSAAVGEELSPLFSEPDPCCVSSGAAYYSSPLSDASDVISMNNKNDNEVKDPPLLPSPLTSSEAGEENHYLLATEPSPSPIVIDDDDKEEGEEQLLSLDEFVAGIKNMSRRFQEGGEKYTAAKYAEAKSVWYDYEPETPVEEPCAATAPLSERYPSDSFWNQLLPLSEAEEEFKNT